MFKVPHFVSSLAFCQFLMLLVEGVFRLSGQRLPALVVWWPLALLLSVAVVFWGIVGAIVKVASSK